MMLGVQNVEGAMSATSSRRAKISQAQENRGGLVRHYGGTHGCGYNNISMQIIEKVRNGDHARLAERETYWQNQLRCYVENEGGGHCYRKEF